MIALSAYKLSTYLVDVVQFRSDDVKSDDLVANRLSFIPNTPPSRNNCFFSLDPTENKHCYFFKQTKSFSDTNIRDFRSEAEFYRLIQNNKTIQEFLPESIFFDAYNIVIVTKYFPKLKELTNAFNSDIYKQAGKCVALFHKALGRKPIEKFNKRAFKWITDFREYTPSLLRLTDFELRALERRGNPFITEFVNFIESNRLLIDVLQTTWQASIEGLIHGDARDANFSCLLKNGVEQVKILDFEYVSYGAWFWDISVFVASVLSKTNVPTVPSRGGLGATTTAYERIRLFCKGYFLERQVDTALREMYEKRILQWAGIYFLQRLFQTEDFIDLQNGLALVTKTEACWEAIFKQI